MNTFIVIIYLILMAVFIAVSALIIRHAVKYAYLSPRFKNIVAVFGLLAVGVIIFSLYLLISLFRTPSASSGSINSTPSVNTPSGINF